MLSQFINLERVLYALLFLFPVFGMLIKHWLTMVYNVLFLLGLYYLKKRKIPLTDFERNFLIICAVYVAIFLLSSVVNGWGGMQTRYLETEIRFIFVIPIYLMVREYPESWKWLLWGGLLSTGMVFFQSVYEVFFEDANLAEGVYSKVIFGPFSALIAFWVLSLWRTSSTTGFKVLILIGFCLAIVSALMSGSRGAYFGILVMCITTLIIFVRTRSVIILGIFMLLVPYFAYQQISIVNNGVDKAVEQFNGYFSNNKSIIAVNVETSVGTRLEMWRAAKYFFPDNPFLGIGPGNYQVVAKKYAEEGKVNAAIAQYRHPHNAYLEALYSKGIIGLFSLLLLLYYPVYFMVKTIKISRNSAVLVMLHIFGISAFSMVEAAPILMNKYTSILLLGMAVFISYHMYQLKISGSQE